MNETPFLTTLPRRAVIAITGADARDFLQRVVTNGPQGVEPGKALASSLLTPQGKVLADLMFFDDGAGGLYVDVPVSEAEGLLKRFTLYRLRAKAELALRDDLMVAAARGREAADRLEALALSAASDPRDGRLGLRAILPVSSAIPDQAASHDAARTALIVPELGADYAPAAFFSTDVNHDLLNAIHYRKGCFVGQEVASRMHRKGGVRKRTVRVNADAALEAGAPVMAGEVPLGEMLGVSGGEGLALIRVDRLIQAREAGKSVSAGAQPVQIVLPE